MTSRPGPASSSELGLLVDHVTAVRRSIFTVGPTRPDGHAEPGAGNAERIALARPRLVSATSGDEQLPPQAEARP